MHNPRFVRGLPWGLAAVAACAVMGLASSARADDTHAIGSATATRMYSPDAGGNLADYVRGGGLALTYLCGCDSMSFGGELGVNFLRGDQRRLYDFALSFMISYNLRRATVAPFMAIGIDLVGLEDPRLDESEHALFGVHGRFGLHGFASDKIYWRGYVGFLGAGPGGVSAGVGIGYLFGGGRR